MYDPTLFPYVRVQNYLDDNPPQVTSSDFYNPAQDSIAQLFGAACGLSCSIACDEFDRESPGLVAVNGQVGTDFTLYTATNAEALSTSAIASGDHGIWKLQSNAASFKLIIRDNMVFPGTRRFLFGARVRFTGSANFETRANEGVVVGMWGAAADSLPAPLKPANGYPYSLMASTPIQVFMLLRERALALVNPGAAPPVSGA